MSGVMGWLACLPAAAQTDLPLPTGASQTSRVVEDPGTYGLPVGRFTPDTTPVQTLDGRILTRTWRWPLEAGGPLRVRSALRDHLLSQGFQPVFACSTTECGGFDFRFSTRVTSAPAMEFDLTDFYYLAMDRQEEAGRRVLSILLSRSPRGGFAQLIERIPGHAATLAIEVPPEPEVDSSASPESLGEALQTKGRAILSDVEFAPGATALAEGSGEALAQVAQYLVANPVARLVIVGHTDNQGALESNMQVGRNRAAAVRSALIQGFGIATNRLEVAGAGYLSPLVPNTNDANRAINRRVEVVLR